MSTSHARTTEPLQFAYWVPNVSGGLVISDIEQRTGWDYDYNKRLAQTAENNGFDYALTQVRYTASYGAAYQHEATSFSLALLLATERLKVISAVHPYMWHPGVLAKFIATADHLSDGRAAINVVSRLVQGRGDQHGRAVARARRALPDGRGVHRLRPRDLDRASDAEFRGDFFQLHDFDLKPKPLDLPGPPAPRRSSRAATPAVRAGDGRPRQRLVLRQRQHPRRHRRADRRRQRVGAAPAGPARCGSASTASWSPATPRPRPTPRSRRSSPRPTPRPSRASATRSSRPGSPPATRRGCGRTPTSATSCSTTTASAPAWSARPSRSRTG